jgi:endonuclease YncB( thermonuclease family)
VTVARSLFLVMVVLLAGACTAEPAASPPSTHTSLKPPTLINDVVPPQDVITVVRDVIDGRTIELADGSKVRVASLAAPAPCWSEAALTFARTTLLARSVRFTGLTPGEVNLQLEDGTDYAVLAVQAGALRPEGVDGGPLINAEAEASAAKRGLWGPPCEGAGTTKAPAPTTTAAPPQTTTPPSAPPTTPPTTFRLRGEASGRCLDVNGARTANGTQMITWDCHNNANQQFTLNGQTLQVTGKCVDALRNAGSGTQALIWDCNGADNQKWNLTTTGTITNVQSGLCLTSTSNNSGAAVTVSTCNNSAGQRWARA